MATPTFTHRYAQMTLSCAHTMQVRVCASFSALAVSLLSSVLGCDASCCVCRYAGAQATSPLSVRRGSLQDAYGFMCECGRCLVEQDYEGEEMGRVAEVSSV